VEAYHNIWQAGAGNVNAHIPQLLAASLISNLLKSDPSVWLGIASCGERNP